MKKIEWLNSNKMKFESAHKTFNKQCRLISTGNQIGDVVISSYIRAYDTDKNPIGESVAKGTMQEWDLSKGFMNDMPDHLKRWIRNYKNRVIAYKFLHHNKDKKIIDGFVVTTDGPSYKLLKIEYSNNNWKSRDAVNEAIKYISTI